MMPIIIGGFGNLTVPLQIKTRYPLLYRIVFISLITCAFFLILYYILSPNFTGIISLGNETSTSIGKSFNRYFLRNAQIPYHSLPSSPSSSGISTPSLSDGLQFTDDGEFDLLEIPDFQQSTFGSLRPLTEYVIENYFD
ncbi:MAG: hypothetical protein GY679_04420 [Mycoplasma sp.]|nr:hypothetical protein [Mycoplasma sp.]